MDLQHGLKKIITIFNDEKIPYMIVGGFATSFYNQYRFTADIDCILQIYPNHIEKIVKYFPDWLPFIAAPKTWLSVNSCGTIFQKAENN